MRPDRPAVVRILSSAALAAVLALSVAGCQTTGDDITGSIGATGTPRVPQTDAQWRDYAKVWGARYDANPGDADAAMAYARALRATGQRAQAVAVLRQSSMRNPNNRPLLGAYGRALADAGDYQDALNALDKAHTPDNPNWRILNAQGAVLDQMGRHQEAQRYYSSALKMEPNEPSVLSNLGLSYALEKHLKLAERTLRKAAAQPGAQPKVRQNLALIVGLEGRFAEAEKIARADLPPAQAEANVAYLREMLARQNELTKRGRRHSGSPSFVSRHGES
ncbi:MAG TPA: tetratricopeptide repeat protein [Pseudolabrys sp.]|nr:tetratricopeptide repeat protein [Pseudolabrys sp.]